MDRNGKQQQECQQHKVKLYRERIVEKRMELKKLKREMAAHVSWSSNISSNDRTFDVGLSDVLL